MSEFEVYFTIGRDHILQYVYSYDHILFVIALCSVYLVRDWRNILVLVTAFTIGHSITLALATLNIITVNTGVVEFLIPLTIFVTAVSNIFRKDVNPKSVQLNYFYALFFGLIHGLGFSSSLRPMLGSQSIFVPLFAFNLGLELGQIIIVALFLVVSYIAVDLLKADRRIWKVVISSAIAVGALIIAIDRKFW